MSLFFLLNVDGQKAILAKGLFCRYSMESKIWSRIHSFRSFSADATFLPKEKSRDVNIISFILMALDASGYAMRPLLEYARQNRSRRGGRGGLEHLGLLGCEIHGVMGLNYPKDR